MAASASSYRASYYNLRIPEGERVLLFNGVTSAFVALPRDLAGELEPFLGPPRSVAAGIGYDEWRPPAFMVRDAPRKARRLLRELVEGGFFVDATTDERQTMREEFGEARWRGPMLVTITTTLACNMRCYYCYQPEQAQNQMSPETCDRIIAHSKERLQEGGFRTLNVDWYGGEPMLNQPIIRQYSRAMREYCAGQGIEYRASMISNGTSWPQDVEGFVEESGLTSLQLTLDGPASFHNRRRGLVKEGGGRAPSYDEIIALIDRLAGRLRLYLRINVDPAIGRHCLDLVDEFVSRGWLTGGKEFFPYIALINAMTEHCGFIGEASSFNDFAKQFDDIEREFNHRVAQVNGQRGLEVVQYAPRRVFLNCAAVNENSVVFGPDGLMYKCGLDVGDRHRAHDALGLVPGDIGQTLVPQLDPRRWTKFDPFEHERCSRCQYLPLCMGGCPKAQIEVDAKQIAMQSRYWETNAARMIREYWSASLAAR